VGNFGLMIALLAIGLTFLDAISQMQSTLGVRYWFGPPIAPVWLTYLSAPLVIYVGLITVSVLPTVLVPVFLLPLTLMLLPFGWEAAVAAPFIEISAEATPPGTWSVTQLSGRAALATRDNRSESAMMHSAAYDSHLAILQLTVFILEGRKAALRANQVEVNEKLGPNLT
jgi:hypothetical protein